MRIVFFVFTFFASLGVFAGEGNWMHLFNGKDFTGWKQLNGKAKYEVIDGEIVGTTVTNTPNSFLATEKEYGDFILELELYVDPRMNSGIQIRSLSKPEYNNGRVHGYQCEIDPSERAWSGGIYDEARRGWLYPLDFNPCGQKAFRNNEWNHYRIEVIGNSIRTWINGIPCADLVDDMTTVGFIALQVHSIGSNSEQAGRQIKWRNIRIQTENLRQSPWTDIPVVNLIPNNLSPQERAQGWKLLFDGKTVNGWKGTKKDGFPEKGWKVEDGELVIIPNGGGGDIITEEAFSTFELKMDVKLTEGANSGIKYFIQPGSSVALEYQFLDDEKHPDAKMGAAGNRTMGSLYDLIPAHKNKIVAKIGEWNHVRVVVSGVRKEIWPKGSNVETKDFVGAHVEHWLNDRKILQYERGDQAFDAAVARSKFAEVSGFGHWQSGHILIQEHQDQMHFRSIKIRVID